MRNIILIILFSAFNLHIHAQNWEWASVGNDGGLGLVQLGCIAVDKEGNSYVTGEFDGNLLVIDTFKLVNHGLKDVFWAKFDATGKCVWAKSTGGKGDDHSGGIAVNSIGEAFVLLSFSDTLNDNLFSLQDTGWANDILLAKFDNNGNLLQYKSWGSPYNENVTGITIDKKDEVYILGTFSGYSGSLQTPLKDTIFFDSVRLISKGYSDAFIVKLDTAMSVIWAKSCGSVNGEYTNKVSVNENDGSILITGLGSSYMDFDAIHLTSGNNFVFVAKYDSLGNALWAKAGGVDNPGSFGIFCVGGKDGCVYCTGVYDIPSNVGPSIIWFDNYLLSGDYAFLVKYSPSGQLVWAKNLGKTDRDAGEDIAIDTSNNLYVTGTFNYRAVFGTDSFVSMGHDDMFVNKYDSAGNHIWTVTAGGQTNDGGYAITLDKEQNIYVGGYISSQPAYFGSHQISATYNWDMCVAKINPLLTGINETMQQSKNSNIYPNPNNGNFTIDLKGKKYQHLSITDLTGKTVYTQELGNSNNVIINTTLPNGMYFIKLQGKDGQVTEKMMIEK